MIMEIKPKIEKLRIIGCPEGCRKKFISERALNIHLSIKHDVNYLVKIEQGYAYKRMGSIAKSVLIK